MYSNSDRCNYGIICYPLKRYIFISGKTPRSTCHINRKVINRYIFCNFFATSYSMKGNGGQYVYGKNVYDPRFFFCSFFVCDHHAHCWWFYANFESKQIRNNVKALNSCHLRSKWTEFWFPTWKICQQNRYNGVFKASIAGLKCNLKLETNLIITCELVVIIARDSMKIWLLIELFREFVS